MGVQLLCINTFRQIDVIVLSTYIYSARLRPPCPSLELAACLSLKRLFVSSEAFSQVGKSFPNIFHLVVVN